MLTDKQIIRPAAIGPSGTIGIAAPAGAFDHERFRRGVAVLEHMGFKVRVPPGVFEKTRYLAGSDEHRAACLHDLFRDPAVEGILCARGGFGSLRILELLDFELIGNNPRVVAGFSDVSVLLAAILKKTGLVTFHAPVITSLAEAGPATREALLTAFTSQTLIEYRAAGPVITGGRASGFVCGGNLASLCHLVGTPFQLDCAGGLLFLEDINEPAYRVDRMLTQMRLAGALDKVAGVLLGRFTNCGHNRVIHEIVREHVGGDIPLLAGLAAGHEGRNLTLPLGLKATMDAEQGTLRYDGPAVMAGDG
ncbi:MAG: LD-carboxypeptidase [Desulfosudaceae bacterium]